MKVVSALFLFVLAASTGVFAQGAATKTVKSQADAATASNVEIAEQVSAVTSASVSGKLEKTLDVNKAKVGDDVLLKTTKAVKENGRTVIDKGSVLVGRVTEVEKKTKANASSSVSVLFDKMIAGGKEMPISAAITSVVSATTSAAAVIDSDMSSATSARSSRSNGSGGGLLGGVGSTAGGVLNTTTQTVGGVGNVAGSTVGSTTNVATGVTGSAAGSIAGLTISSSTNASAGAGSTLTMNGGNLRLEKGTVFNLNVTSSSSVEKK
ncbi:MAG: hypothetical protein KF881_01350 [Acidobacteria bacterium]|nr:hypothetical protein [Acidobacteriota bacterium]